MSTFPSGDFYVPLTPHPTPSPTPSPLSGKLLVLPVVSTANIAQLAADLLIATLGLKRWGVFDDRWLIPAVGGREEEKGADGEENEGGGGVTLPLELFGREDLEFVVMQQRTPVLKAFKEDFVSTLCAWISKSGFRAVLILSGMDLLYRTDSQMSTPTYYLLPTSNSHPISIFNLDGIPPFTSSSSSSEDVHSNSPSLRLPGSGLTKRILDSPALTLTTELPRVALVQFVMEGDNRHDAHTLARTVLGTLSVPRAKAKDGKVGEEEGEVKMKEPASWLGLFGQGHDGSLFG